MTGMYHSFGPFKGMCMLVMHLSVGIYGLAYIAHRDGDQPLQGLSPQDAEPAFYLIEPRGMGGGVVKMDLRMPRQPTVMLGFMDVQVIQDDMQFSARILGNNAIHESSGTHGVAVCGSGRCEPIRWPLRGQRRG